MSRQARRSKRNGLADTMGIYAFKPPRLHRIKQTQEMIAMTDILNGPPPEPGWYAALVSIPEDGWLEAAHWDGTEWSWEKKSRNYKVAWAYAQKFVDEASTEAWIDAQRQGSHA